MSTIWNSVYELVRSIPKGQVITYGSLARATRLRGGAREAGHAMAACPKGRGIPWHRVVGANGRLLIREPHATLQRKLLTGEGTGFVGGRVDIERHEWLPPATRKRPKRKLRSVDA